MVVPLLVRLEHNAALFQQVSPHVGTDDMQVLVEVDFDVLSEAGAVIVSRRFRVAYGLCDVHVQLIRTRIICTVDASDFGPQGNFEPFYFSEGFALTKTCLTKK